MGEGWLGTMCGRAANAKQNSGSAVSSPASPLRSCRLVEKFLLREAIPVGSFQRLLANTDWWGGQRTLNIMANTLVVSLSSESSKEGNLTDVCFYQSCSLFCRAQEPAEVKKLMGEVGIKQKDQMHQVIAKGIKTIQHLRVAINVKCCSLISDIWLTASKYSGDCTVRGKMWVSWNVV